MSQSKRFHVFEEGLHEYTIVDKPTTKGRKISLFYSDAEQWTSHTRGTLVMKMTVTGNGVRFSKNTKSMDYSELFAMRLLMNYERETDTNEHNREKSQFYSVDNTNKFEL
jgi:hypothetical protein